MRRNEFQINDVLEINSFLNEQTYGTLSIFDSYERTVHQFPLNFVKLNNEIFLHTFSESFKVTLIIDNPEVSFSVVKEYSMIPSYFLNTDACSATQFFKSVIVQATASLIEEKELKKEVLTALMKKLQPEGGFDPEAIPEKMYLQTAVIRLKIDKCSAKYKFGQNLGAEKLNLIKQKLNERGRLIDLETIEMIDKFATNRLS